MIGHLPFEPEAIKAYLDRAITAWRSKREDRLHAECALYYIDAYQSVRLSIFGEALPFPPTVPRTEEPHGRPGGSQ